MELRRYRETDTAALAKLYEDAVRVTAASAYSLAERDAWAKFPSDLNAFHRELAQGETLVAIAGFEIAGFGQLHPEDHIALLYTAPRCARQGIATALYRELEARARERGTKQIRTEASRLSRPFFTKMGFALSGTDTREYHGVVFHRYVMHKEIRRRTQP
jgi:putative acetyltransferase